MKRIDKIKSVFFITLAVLSLAYYGLCLLYAWAGVSWLWIWPLLSGFCLIRFLMIRKGIHVPKWLRICYGVLLILFVLAFLIIEGNIISEMNAQAEPGLDYIITLGAAIRNGQPTTPLILRMNAALEYLENNPDTVCVASGGQGPAESSSEAACIAGYLTENGIDPSRILIEDQSRDTEENIANSFVMIPDGTSVGIVSNSFHLYRAELIAKLQGHTVLPVPAVTYPILGVHYTVREFFAVVEILLKNLI